MGYSRGKIMKRFVVGCVGIGIFLSSTGIAAHPKPACIGSYAVSMDHWQGGYTAPEKIFAFDGLGVGSHHEIRILPKGSPYSAIIKDLQSQKEDVVKVASMKENTYLFSINVDHYPTAHKGLFNKMYL